MDSSLERNLALVELRSSCGAEIMNKNPKCVHFRERGSEENQSQARGVWCGCYFGEGVQTGLLSLRGHFSRGLSMGWGGRSEPLKILEEKHSRKRKRENVRLRHGWCDPGTTWR